MRLSIWQQFSSNHSGSFHLVGKFNSVQAAQQAAEKIRDITSSVGEHYKDYPEDHDAWGPTSEIENKILDELDLDWDMEFGFTYDVIGTMSINAFDDLMLLRIGQTWNNEQHRVFRPILEKLGAGQIGISSEIDGAYLENFQVKLLCTAPDTATADEIYTDTLAAINAIQTNSTLAKTIGWMNLRNFWDFERAEIDRDGLNLYFTFQFSNPYLNLPTLITGLREKGCTNFSYDFYGREFS